MDHSFGTFSSVFTLPVKLSSVFLQRATDKLFCSIVSSRVLTELLVENCSLSRLAILVSMLSTNILHLYLHPYQGILHLMGALHKWEKTNSCWCIHWVVLKFLGQVYNCDHRNRMSILYQSSRKMNLFFCAFFIGTFY